MEKAVNNTERMGKITYPDGLPKQLDDRGSDIWCSRHGRIPWAMDGICNTCEAEDFSPRAKARTMVGGLALAACLLLPGLAGAQTAKAKRVYIPPAYSITVKVVSPVQYDRKVESRPGAEDPGAWLISSNTPTTCTAWVRQGAGLEAELDAYNGCRWLLGKSGR